MRKKIVFIIFLLFITVSLAQAKSEGSLNVMFKEPTSLLDRTPIDAGYKVVKEGNNYVSYQLENGKDWKKSPQQPFSTEKCKKCTSDEGLLIEAGKYFGSPLVSYAIKRKTDLKITDFNGDEIPLAHKKRADGTDGTIDLKQTFNNVVKATLANNRMAGGVATTSSAKKKCKG